MSFFNKIIGINPIILLKKDMDLLQNLSNHSNQSLTHQLLTSFLKGYKRPNDKIYELISIRKVDEIGIGIVEILNQLF